jgi:hypothetical protein
LTHRRHLDLLVLLLISVFVVSASAAVYYVMNAQSKATVSAAPVYFIAGGDSSGILNLGTGDTYARLSLNAYPNVTLIYDQAVNLTATAAKQIRLSHVSVTPNNNASVSNFVSVVFRLIRANGTEVGTLTYTTTGNTWNTPSPTGYVTISSGEELAVKIEIKAAAGASIGASTTIVIAVDVM